MSYRMKGRGSQLERKGSFTVEDFRRGFEIWDEMEDFDELKTCTNPIFVQFSTLECAESKKLGKKLAQMVEKYSDRIQFVYIDSDRFSNLCE